MICNENCSINGLNCGGCGCNRCFEGPPGPPGPPGNGAIIPFSSGVPITVTSLIGGLIGLHSFVGFGSNASSIDTFGPTIDLTGTVLGGDLNYAFTMPRDGVLTGLNVFFSVTAALGVGLGDYQIHAQLFRSQSPTSNIFDALVATDIGLTPTFPGLGISLGDVATGSATFSIAVSAGDRLLLVFYVDPPALSLAAAFSGYASGGLAIS